MKLFTSFFCRDCFCLLCHEPCESPDAQNMNFRNQNDAAHYCDDAGNPNNSSLSSSCL